METRYGITATLTEGHVLAGESALEDLAPFVTPLEDYDALPDALLDYIALYSFMLADERSGPVVRKAMSPFSTNYARPEPNPHARTARELVGRYLKRTGVRV